MLPPAFGTPNDQAPAMPQGRLAWLRVIIPKDKLYVGEMMPVKVKAYFRLGLKATLNGLPTLSSDAFTLNKLSDDANETTEVFGGVPYTVLTWPSALAAVKAGDYSLGLELPVLVRVRDRTARPSNPFQSMGPKGFFDNPFFNDSFFDDFFGATREKPMTLKTDPSAMHIKPLPAANRPAEFTGAVGQFEVSSEATPTDVTAGDPVTLKITVTGSGNFDRVTLSGLASSTQWKTYQPTEHFEANGTAGYEGTKTFEQAVVPKQAGRETIPALTFCYFDPESGQYVTRSTQPITVEVATATGTPALASASSSPATGSPTSPADSTNTSPGSSLAPDKPESGRVAASLRPVFVSPWFLALQGTLLALLAGGLWGQRWRARLVNNPERRRTGAIEQSIRQELKAMDAAMATNDTAGFFNAARNALQERLSERWKLPAPAITIAEIDRRLNGNGESIRTVFQLAERVAYSGLRYDTSFFEQWKRVVGEQLNLLEAA